MPNNSRRFVELSHEFTAGMQTFPGFPVPVMSQLIPFGESVANTAEGQEYVIEYVGFTAGSGTYIDSARHFSSKGGDIASLSLEGLIDVPVVIVPAPEGRREYLPEDFAGVDVAGHAVLAHTGYSAYWNTPAYAAGSPFVGRKAAEHLRDAGAAIVGIDAVLIDDIEATGRVDWAAHVTLLGAGIPIIENLTGLDLLPATGVRLTAAPVRAQGLGSFPVRAYATIDGA
ncbi:cyclase family protein [Streptomyces sp. NPDC026672]|uniref:cyclase family protein n=1 Tax=unclassified Streptomyces TaxID=2593676 RepID=UPI0033C8C4B3